MEDWEIVERLAGIKHKVLAAGLPVTRITEDEVQNWEKKWGVELPTQYRRFLLEVSNGLRTPRRTILSLEQSMTTARGTDWAPDLMPTDYLRQPFPHTTHHYNPDFSPEIKIADELPDEEYSLWWLNQLRGTLLLSDDGNGISSFLIVTGPQRGQVWCDLTITGDGYDRIEWNFLDWLGTAL